MRSSSSTSATYSREWRATLHLTTEVSGGRTILRRVSHEGPLRVQRAFYPERDGTCHVVLLHPPGGVVQGDQLAVNLEVGARSQCLVTTPGATKFYRSEGQISRMVTKIQVASGGRCEWLPQEAIVFDGAVAQARTQVKLESDASFIGWEIACLGRPAADELFEHGQYTSHFELLRNGHPLLSERLAIAGNTSALSQAWGLRGAVVVGTLVLAVPGQLWVDSTRKRLSDVSSSTRLADGASSALGWCGTELEGVSVFRALGASAEAVRGQLSAIWDLCRLQLGTDGHHWPRIWRT